MDATFWESRWEEGRIGFHQDRPTPLLVEHWPSLGIAKGARVFVPLCGKSLDMAWFASQGLRVLGVELSKLAVEQFFEEHGLAPHVEERPDGTHYRAGEIEIVCGDAFGLEDALLEGCDAYFDRAALIALPSGMRKRYVERLYGRLPAGCRGLLVTLEYPQHEKSGPPFSVEEEEVRCLHEPYGGVDVRERCDILDLQPAFVEDGVTALDTVVYRLDRR